MDHLAGGWSMQGKHTDAQDLANIWIDQGPRDSDSVELAQGLGICMFNKCHS